MAVVALLRFDRVVAKRWKAIDFDFCVCYQIFLRDIVLSRSGKDELQEAGLAHRQRVEVEKVVRGGPDIDRLCPCLSICSPLCLYHGDRLSSQPSRHVSSLVDPIRIWTRRVLNSRGWDYGVFCSPATRKMHLGRLSSLLCFSRLRMALAAEEVICV